MAIFRIAISKKKKGKIFGYKLVEGKSIEEVRKKPKSSFVGAGRYVVGITPTKLKGTVVSRRSLPRSKRF